MHPDHVRYQRTKLIQIHFLIFLAIFLFGTAASSMPGNFDQPIIEKNHKSISENHITFSDQGLKKVVEDELPLSAESTGPVRKLNWLIYAVILFVVLYILRRYEVSRIKMSSQMRIANIEKGKLKDINRLKSRFYTNISHEFRTPLTLIKGPLEQLMQENADPQKRKIYKQMHASASRLLELINQLLELSKIESGQYTLKAQQGDIVDFIEGLAMSFKSLAEQKDIALEIKVSPELLESEIRNNFYYDPDILENIINNLISNAFKFTPTKGCISIHMRLIRKSVKTEFLEITIKDTGIGIEPDKLPFIFDRFYQVDSNNSYYEGSGVGLSIVNELITLHKSEISVRSEPESGTIFMIRIPAGSSHLLPDQIYSKRIRVSPDSLPPQAVIPEELSEPILGNYKKNSENPWVLIVEDHEQVRKYIVESIRKDYRILQASNAPDGYNLAQEFIPDLIVSDIMMPGMDGFMFCEKIKNSKNTSHIPIILLTARADINDRITGLKGGADDYLTKPFNAEELRTRINNLIENRNALRQKFSSNSIIKPGEISVSSHDASFIELSLGLIEKNISNVHYSVEEFSRDAGLSQSQMHRKLKAIVGISAIQFIRSVRMHRAMELLKNGAGNIAEIAYMVGYDDPGYFTKSFRKFFDKLPSEVTKN